MPWNLLGIILIVCAVLCAVGFYKFVYFLSIGYGFAVAGGGIAVFIMYLINPTATPLWLVFVQMVLFVAYGVRLSGFLLVRELKSITFRKTDVAKDTLSKNNEKKMPVFVLATIWICVSVLYVAQVSPMLFRFANGSADTALPVIGVIISVLGLVLESIADQQKSAQKKVRPDMVATQGLYKIVRCPNYLGELIFWTGTLISGLGALQGWGQWIMSIIGYAGIIFVMFSGARRLEIRQDKNYGSDPEYQKYVTTVPILLPFIPLYSVKKHKWLVA